MILTNSYAAQGRRLPPRRGEPVSGSGVRTSSPITGVQVHTTSGVTQSPYYFETLRFTDDRANLLPWAWTSTGSQPGSWARSWLSSLSWFLYDNYPLVGYIVDTIALYSVPVTAMSATDDDTWNKQADDIFTTRSKVIDYTGRFNLNQLLDIVCKSQETSGDIGLAATTAHGFMQLQVIEGWRIGSPNELPIGEKVIDGVSVTEEGEVLGYWVQKSPGVFQPISANEMVLLYDVDRYSHYRGLSPMRRGMNDVRDHADIKGFERLGVKSERSIVGAIDGGGPLDEDAWGNSAENAAPAATATNVNVLKAAVSGGDIITVPNGQRFSFQNTGRPGQGVLDFLNYLGTCFIMGMGFPPEFLIKSSLKGPELRLMMGQAQRKADKRQELIGKAVAWTRNRVIAEAIERGELTPNPKWDAVRLQGPQQITIDAGREMQQEREDVLNGLMSRQRYHANQNQGWEDEVRQTFREGDFILTLAREQATRFGVSVESILQAHGFTAAKQQQPEESESPAKGQRSQGEQTEKVKSTHPPRLAP